MVMLYKKKNNSGTLSIECAHFPRFGQLKVQCKDVGNISHAQDMLFDGHFDILSVPRPSAASSTRTAGSKLQKMLQKYCSPYNLRGATTLWFSNTFLWNENCELSP